MRNASLARSEKHRRIKIAKTEEHALLFHIFHSQKERRDFGGSDFIEMQYCKLEQDSEIEKSYLLMQSIIGKTIHYISLATI